MDVRSDTDKSDEVLLPGFRFHPTDEELVGFYLRRKIQQKPLSIELIRQLDIYKHDPWDLPKLASTGEKEWYFYCPRDRKYRNSARPNRVTGAGFWKATGTDRPIYSSEGAKCIGLKKSLVFYRGRAARGIKTDWMMHEFRLPSLSDPSLAKRPFDKGIPANDSWTICRIFKKTSSMAQRALSHSWGPPLPGTSETDLFSALQSVKASPFALESSSCTPQEAAPANRFTDPQDGSSCKVINFNCGSSYAHASNKEVHDGPIILPFETQTVPKNSDFPSLHLGAVLGVINSMDKDSPGTDFGQPEQCSGFALDWPASMNGIIENAGEDLSSRKTGNEFGMNNEWGNPRRGSFPFDLGADFSDEWRCNIPWESLLPSPIAPAEISNSCSTEKCYT